MTPLLATWLCLMLLAAVLSIAVARQWGDTLSPRDAAATLLTIWGVTLATIAVIAIVEVQP